MNNNSVAVLNRTGQVELMPEIKSMLRHTISAKLKLFILLGAFGGAMARAQSNFSIYSDQLNNGFQNWGYNSGACNFSNTSPVHSTPMPANTPTFQSL
jgi:hypothetical protein